MENTGTVCRMAEKDILLAIMTKRFLLVVAIVLWIGALACALWWYNHNFIRTEFFVGQHLQLPQTIAGAGKIRLVHFWDPGCPCNLGNQAHLADLTRDYAAAVDFYHVQKPGSGGHLPKNLASLQPLALTPGQQALPASPAVAIFDNSGQLAYFGPYSEGAICNASNSFVEPILDALQQGRTVRAGSNLASGCFCTW